MPEDTRVTPTTLHDRILKISQIQARRFSKLEGNASKIARRGIIRHFRACAKTDIKPREDAIREIISDAILGVDLTEKVNDDEAYLLGIEP